MSGGMRVWALIGPTGAGKSVVAELLAQRGAAIVDGDQLGHRVLSQPAVQAAVSREWGQEMVHRGEVDRRALGKKVFGDPQALAVLNAITHPPLVELAQRELSALQKKGKHELAVFEAAVYFLLPSPPVVDLVVAVVAPLETRLARLVSGPARLTEEAARARIDAQHGLKGHWPRADEIIVNGGTLDDLSAAVQKLWVANGLGNEAQP